MLKRIVIHERPICVAVDVAEKNINFAQLVADGTGKTIEQIAEEYDLDLQEVRHLIHEICAI